MGFTDRKPWTITEKDVAGKWGLGKDTRLKCYLCDKIAAVGDTFRWLYMNGHSPSPGNVMCCAGCDHVGIEDEIRAALVAWQKDFPGCNYEIRPAMKLADLERRLAEALRDSERLAWAWANPDKFLEAQRSTPPDKTGREQIDAARKEGV